MPVTIHPRPHCVHYVYVYHDPRVPECLPYYVGGGNGNRVVVHLKKSKSHLNDNPHNHFKTQAILRTGVQPEITIEWYGNSLNERNRVETALIAKWGREGIDPGGILTNIAPGGGARGIPECTRKKMSIALKGRPLSAEHRRNLRIAQKGKIG